MIGKDLGNALSNIFYSDSDQRVSVHYYDREKKEMITKNDCSLVNDIEQNNYSGSNDDVQTIINLETFDGRI
jgi:hypothetical protein